MGPRDREGRPMALQPEVARSHARQSGRMGRSRGHLIGFHGHVVLDPVRDLGEGPAPGTGHDTFAVLLVGDAATIVQVGEINLVLVWEAHEVEGFWGE